MTKSVFLQTVECERMNGRDWQAPWSGLDRELINYTRKCILQFRR